ncbi:MAG: hypothetical protein AB1599_05085 [Planctomycetota bacterium]
MTNKDVLKPQINAGRRRYEYVITFLVMSAALIYLFFGPTGVRQGINMRKARNHLPAINNVIQQYPDFKNIRLGVFTGMGGSILITGHVKSKKDIDALKKLVDSTNPPVNVKYSLWIEDEIAQKQKSKEQK